MAYEGGRAGHSMRVMSRMVGRAIVPSKSKARPKLKPRIDQSQQQLLVRSFVGIPTARNDK